MSENSPEIKLWRAVVAQAFADATGIVRQPKPTNTKDAAKQQKSKIAEAIIARDRARHWLLRGGKDFRHVCHLAGLDHEAVREKAQGLSRREWVVRNPSRVEVDDEDDMTVRAA